MSKAQEAQQHCRAAEKYLKTSFLKWKPEYDSAADEYCQAAQCYRGARQLENTKDCYQKAAEYYLKNKSLFHAAKALENAIIAAKDTLPPDEIYRLAMESSSLYQQHGSGDSGANVLDKAAKILEGTSPERAYKLYHMAADVSSSESSAHQGMEYLSKATRLLVRLNKYDEAIDSIRREVDYNLEASNFGAVGRLAVAAVLVQLARGDVVAAEKSYRKWGGNCDLAEGDVLERLLGAYDQEDAEGARSALSAPFIRSMDVEFSRLAARIELPRGEYMLGASRIPVTTDAATATTSTAGASRSRLNSTDNTKARVEVVKEPAKGMVQVPIKELLKDPAKEPAKELVKEPAKELVKEPAKELVKEPAKVIIKEPAKEIVKEPAQEIVKEPAKELVKGPVMEQVTGPAEEPLKEPAKELVKDPVKKLVKEPTEKPTEEPFKKSVKEVKPRPEQIEEEDDLC